MKNTKIFSILITLALLISFTITPATSAMELTENQTGNSYEEIEFLVNIDPELPELPEIDPELSEVSPLVAPIVYFIAAACAKLIAKKLANVAIKFSKHAIDQANDRKVTTQQLADTITGGKKYMDNISRARAIYDKNENILVVFVGNTKEVATIIRPDGGNLAKKFVNSNWGW